MRAASVMAMHERQVWWQCESSRRDGNPSQVQVARLLGNLRVCKRPGVYQAGLRELAAEEDQDVADAGEEEAKTDQRELSSAS